MDPTDMAFKMEEKVRQKVQTVFPTKQVRISADDKPFITAEIKKLDKYVKKEYKLRGKSDKYCKLKRIYDDKFKKASSDYLNGVVKDMMTEAPGKAYRALKKLGARPGDCDDDTGFVITSHVDQSLRVCHIWVGFVTCGGICRIWVGICHRWGVCQIWAPIP